MQMQTRKSLRCSHTRYMDVDEDWNQNLELLACWLHQHGHLCVISNKKSLDFYIWAVTCDFQQCSILTCVDSDEPVQPPFKL